jgi:phage host-nuclease inhibitor protein Gam
MTQKAKFTPCIVTSREGMEATVADVVRLKLEFAQKTAAMELEVAAVQKRYQAQLLEISNKIETKEAGIFVFCQTNRRELFAEKKSIDLLLATVGFRTEPPSVEKKGKDTWGAIAKRLASLDWGVAYVTEPAPEIDKKALLADRAKLTPEQLDQAGIRFEADEVFYINPKSEVAEASVKAA